MNGFDHDFLGHAPADGDRYARLDILDQNGPTQDSLRAPFDDIARVKSQREQATAYALAANDIDELQRHRLGGKKKIYHRPSTFQNPERDSTHRSIPAFPIREEFSSASKRYHTRRCGKIKGLDPASFFSFILVCVYDRINFYS
jgi:hypothetical protein